MRRYILGRLATRQPVITERYIEGYAKYDTTVTARINNTEYTGTRDQNTGYFRIDLPLDLVITSLYNCMSNAGDKYTFINFSHIGDVSKCTNAQYFCESNQALTSVVLPSNFRMPLCTTINGMFRSDTVLTSLDISMLSTDNIGGTSGNNNAGTLVYQCNALTKLKLPSFKNNVYFGSISFQAPNVTDLSFAGTIDCIDSYDGLRFQYMTKLTDASLDNLINALSDRSSKSSQVLYISSESYSKLTDTQKSIASRKNWTISTK